MPHKTPTPDARQQEQSPPRFTYTLELDAAPLRSGLGGDMLWRRRRQVETSRRHLVLVAALLALLALGGLLYEYAF